MASIEGVAPSPSGEGEAATPFTFHREEASLMR
jgi:hypothetical protein